jgi:hypothetical protein
MCQEKSGNPGAHSGWVRDQAGQIERTQFSFWLPLFSGKVHNFQIYILKSAPTRAGMAWRKGYLLRPLQMCKKKIRSIMYVFKKTI